MTTDLLQAARNVHALGLNVIPVTGKVPSISGWKTWQVSPIPADVLSSWKWNSQTTGLAVVLGFADVHDIEFDHIADDATAEEICDTMLTLLPGAWLYRSGSRNGVHCVFRCAEKNPLSSSVTSAGPKTPGKFDHAELRWEKSLSVLPPSVHESGHTYDWLTEPAGPPPMFTAAQVLGAWQSLTAPVERASNAPVLLMDVPEGQRHAKLCSIVGTLKNSKLSNEIMPFALGWNRGLSQPLPEKEVIETVNSLCKALPTIEPERIPIRTLREYLFRVEGFVRRYVVFPSEHESVAFALWIAHSWIVDRFEVSPILAVTSAEMRSGKTRVLDCAELLVPYPFRSVLPSEAVTYSILAQRPRPTFFLDEADAIFGARPSERTEGLRAIFNSGNMQGTPVYRVSFFKGQRKVESFDCFGPKAIAGIGTLPSTVADRSVLIRMRRRSSDEPLSKFRRKIARAEAHELYFDWDAVTLVPHVPVPEELNDRAADSWEPLLAIADHAGGDWPQRARRAAIALSAEEQNPSIGMKLLADIQQVFGDEALLETQILLSGLHELEDSPWGDWYGKKLTPRGLAKLLHPYGVQPVQRRLGSRPIRGYFRADFVDVWKRYVTSSVSGTSGTSGTDGESVPHVPDVPSAMDTLDMDVERDTRPGLQDGG
jgi:hypothetical protein